MHVGGNLSSVQIYINLTDFMNYGFDFVNRHLQAEILRSRKDIFSDIIAKL